MQRISEAFQRRINSKKQAINEEIIVLPFLRIIGGQEQHEGGFFWANGEMIFLERAAAQSEFSKK
ncbi:MAG: hypothetical protein AAGI23_00775 [Bacteroidota bacterium]